MVHEDDEAWYADEAQDIAEQQQVATELCRYDRHVIGRFGVCVGCGWNPVGIIVAESTNPILDRQPAPQEREETDGT